MSSILSESKRKNMNQVEISVIGEIFLARILGATMMYKHGACDEKSWKNVLKRMAKAIDRAVQQNVQTDHFHKSQLMKHVIAMDKSCDKNVVSDPEIIFSLVALIFELLGESPNYTDRKRLKRGSDYLLTTQRQLIYRQSPCQKVYTILSASRENPYSARHKYDDLFDKYALTFRSDAEEFLAWYKEKYPDVYLSIF